MAAQRSVKYGRKADRCAGAMTSRKLCVGVFQQATLPSAAEGIYRRDPRCWRKSHLPRVVRIFILSSIRRRLTRTYKVKWRQPTPCDHAYPRQTRWKANDLTNLSQAVDMLEQSEPDLREGGFQHMHPLFPIWSVCRNSATNRGWMSFVCHIDFKLGICAGSRRPSFNGASAPSRPYLHPKAPCRFRQFEGPRT